MHPPLPTTALLPSIAQAMLDNYPSPALFMQQTHRLALNAAAAMLFEETEAWWPELAAWAQQQQGRSSRSPQIIRIIGENTPQLIEWTAVALDAEHSLLLGRNVTTERSLHEVLSESRDRFRDLVELSADLAWEIKADGSFNYIAGGKSLGYSAATLMGKAAADLLVRPMIGNVNYFESRTAVDKKQLWLRRADGSAARVEISARPLFSANQTWRGARGVCHDITDSAARQETLAQIQRRDQLITRFMKSLREAQEARTALEIAATEIATALQASGCRIYNLNLYGDLTLAVESGSALPEVVNSYNRRFVGQGRIVEQQELPNAILMGATTVQGSALNGAIWVWRTAQQGAWPDIDQTLLSEVADHLGVAIAQFDYQEKLRILSECDGLTRLYNRRTFMEKVERKTMPSAYPSALFYVDLDNFKAVNDTHGHQRGDMVIKRIADVLKKKAKEGDYAGRIGGDEFVLWMDNTSRAEAETIAAELVAAATQLRDLSASPEKPLGVSVGVALAQAGETIRTAALLEKADAAMYVAKKGGKSTWAMG